LSPLTLRPGTRFGPYEIISAIGAGGMGEVYRAHDSKLNRDVAIKVLLPAIANDPDRIARFSREAQVLASLNHPNIAAIYGLEDAGDVRALVMELVEGPTLAERIAQGAIPLPDALPIARQLAEALEAAHEQGIIHRDLKPANIKVRSDGTVKVLDFGLAKALDPISSPNVNVTQSPTITSPVMMTNAGMILGTAAYMSPEQASGKPVDRRTDVWSFGVVLWEMLTGKRLFDAETISHTLADVLRLPIDFDKLPAEARTTRDLLRRCLDRDVRNRLRDIGEARIVLENSANSVLEMGVESLPQPSEPERNKVPWVMAAAFALALGGAGFGWWRSTRPVDQLLIRLSVDLGPDALAGPRTTAVLSPDGTRIVFPMRGSNGVRQLAARSLDQPQASLISGSEGGSDAFFSPDGQWIGFFAGGKLKKAALQGGAPVTLCDAAAPMGGSWGDDGDIIFTPDARFGLMRVSSAGGTPQPLIAAGNKNAIRRWPQVLPGGRAVLYTENTNPFNWEDGDIGAVSLNTGQIKIVQHGGYFGRYVPSRYGTGHLLYVHESTLFAVRFDPARLETSGTPVPLLQDVAANFVDAGGQFDGAANGSLVYLSGQAGESSSYPIAWMDSSGNTASLLAKPAAYGALRFSPDGKRLAFTAPGSNGPDVWVYDWERDIPTQLTFTGPGNLEMAWAPDGKHIVFGSSRAGAAALWWVRSDGSGEPQKLLERKNAGIGLRPQSFTPDGLRLAFDDNVSSATGVEIWTLPLDLSDPEHPMPGRPEPFLTSATRQVDATFSPDGKWMAYSSNESGIDEIFVRPFPGPGGKWRVSTSNGKFPNWSRTGHELFYLSFADSRIMVTNYTAQGDAFSAAKPRVWSDRQVLIPNFVRVLDLHPEGKRFAVFPRPKIEEAMGNLHVTFLLNFSDELHRRLP
jgi:serine/threonine protein kinase/WD40 repeat protein